MRKLKTLCFMLCAIFAFSLMPLGSFAVTIENDVQTPPAASSQIDGISITQKGVTGGGVMLEQYALSTLDLSSATYLVIGYYNPTGAAWPFYFQRQENGVIKPPNEGTEYYIYDAEMQYVETKTVQYSAVAPTINGVGYIVIPTASFPSLGTIQALFITLPQAAENQIGVTTLHFSKVGYFTTEQVGALTDMTVLTDFATWTPEWFAGRHTDENGSELAIVKGGENLLGTTYDGGLNGIQVKQVGFAAPYNEGGLMVNTFKDGDEQIVATFDITNANYIAFEMANPTALQSAAALIKLQDTAGAQSTHTVGTGVTIYDREYNKLKDTTFADPYTRLDANQSVWVVYPTSAFEGLNGTIAAVYLVIPSYDPSLNNVAAMQFGRIATFAVDTITDFAAQGTVVADPYEWTYNDYQLRIASTTTEKIVSVDRCKYVEAEKPIIPITCDIGDVRTLEDMDTGFAEEITEYNAQMSQKIYDRVGGLTVEGVEGYTGRGVKFTVGAKKPDAPDPYAGFTFANKLSVNRWTEWKKDGEMEGVTFWVSNLSTVPVSLCFEIDEYDPDQDIATNPSGERWSVGLGGRIILYDTVNNVEMLINATPTVDIPVGFTGWVRIPTSCFTKAAWCTWGNAVLDLVNVPQFTFAINTDLNIGATFILDNIGVYYNKTTVSSIFSDNGNGIKDNMGV